MIEKWISFLALRVSHHITINVSNWNMNTVLEWNYDFHRIYFHLVKFCDLVLFHLNQFSDDVGVHVVVSLVKLNDFVDGISIFILFYF